jgi:hypothetical protein
MIGGRGGATGGSGIGLLEGLNGSGAKKFISAAGVTVTAVSRGGQGGAINSAGGAGGAGAVVIEY